MQRPLQSGMVCDIEMNYSRGSALLFQSIVLADQQIRNCGAISWIEVQKLHSHALFRTVVDYYPLGFDFHAADPEAQVYG